MTYLPDVNALIALGITTHEFHQRVEAWIATLDSPADRLATCAVTELAFVRIVPQLPGLGASVAQAKELLRRLKRQQRVRVRMLADAEDAQRGLAAARILGLSHRRLSLGRSLSGGSKAAWNRSRK